MTNCSSPRKLFTRICLYPIIGKSSQTAAIMSHDKETVEMREKESPENQNISPEVAEALRNYVPGTPEEKKLVRKIDLFLMPMIWVMYILNYIDRMNIVSRLLQLVAVDEYLTDILGRAMPKSQAWETTSPSPTTNTPGSYPSSSSATSSAKSPPT